MKNAFKLRNLIAIAMLIALQVVLSRFLSIQTPFVKIGFAFIPVMFAGALLGPAAGALVGGISDFLGAMLFPFGAYFPGYTITAAFSGAVYGWFFHKKTEKTRIIRIALAYLLTTLLVTLGFNAFFIALQNELLIESEVFSLERVLVVYAAKLPLRLMQAGGMYVVQVLTTYILLDVLMLDRRIRNSVFRA